jgi:hypothetical protein
MKRIILSLLVIAALMSANSLHAQDYRFAMGVRLSNSSPTLNNSISGKYFITEKTAVEGLISFGNRFGMGALVQIHKPLNAEGLRWYYGAGAYVGFEDGDTYLGPNGALGLDYKFKTAPINLSVDWKPELDFLPDINFVPDAFGLTVRFTFQ